MLKRTHWMERSHAARQKGHCGVTFYAARYDETLNGTRREHPFTGKTVRIRVDAPRHAARQKAGKAVSGEPGTHVEDIHDTRG